MGRSTSAAERDERKAHKRAKKERREQKRLKRRLKKAVRKFRLEEKEDDMRFEAPEEAAFREKVYFEMGNDELDAGVRHDAWDDWSDDDEGDWFESIARRMEAKRRVEAAARRAEVASQKPRRKSPQPATPPLPSTPPSTPPRPATPPLPWTPPSTPLAEPTHYERLGVSRDATAETIRKAYYGLARSLHPDKAVGMENAAAAMAALNNAHDVLSDPSARERYDRSLPAGAHSTDR